MTLHAGRRSGVCRFCGCTLHDACTVDDGFDVTACYWTDATCSLCSACAPAAKAEGIALRRLARAADRLNRPTLARVVTLGATFHAGFVVGWFGISHRSRYGRNPYRVGPRDQADHWTRGQRAGAEASRLYQLACGPLENAPRLDALRAVPRGTSRQGSGHGSGRVRGTSRTSRTPHKGK